MCVCGEFEVSSFFRWMSSYIVFLNRSVDGCVGRCAGVFLLFLVRDGLGMVDARVRGGGGKTSEGVRSRGTALSWFGMDGKRDMNEIYRRAREISERWVRS